MHSIFYINADTLNVKSTGIHFTTYCFVFRMKPSYQISYFFHKTSMSFWVCYFPLVSFPERQSAINISTISIKCPHAIKKKTTQIKFNYKFLMQES